jgi:NitT/TauT family transport system ATP-binding protein
LTTAAPDRARVSSGAGISLQQISKSFAKPNGELYTAVAGIDLSIVPGEFVAIVGPSGCGKSTLLNLIAGLSTPSTGRVLLDGKPVRGIDRRVGFLFQDDALLPWRTVEQNVGLGLRLRSYSKDEVKDRVDEWLRKVGLTGFEKHFPAQLSGGMRKRAAIAQTLIYDPDVILMDEPFAHLDAQARHIMQQDLMQLFAEKERTIVLVTHDLDEAISLADRVVVMTAGPASHIRATQNVPFSRPRDLIAVRSEHGFVDISRALWHHLYEEVHRTYGR